MITKPGATLTAVEIIPEMRSNPLVRQKPFLLRACGQPAARGGRLLLAALTLLLALPSPAGTAPFGTSSWRTGAALERHWQAPVRMVRWVSNPLRDALESLASTQQVAMFLDRRVDPDRRIDFSSQDEPLSPLLGRLAAELDLGMCRIGPVVYFGPPETAAVLPTVVPLRREERESLARGDARRLEQPRPLAWPKLTTPRQLIRHVAEEAGLAVENIEQIPHDLWPAVELPPLDFYQQMTLVLAGFGLTFQFQDEGRLRLVALPERAELQRDHAMPARLAAHIESRLQREYPEVQVVRQSQGLRVRGPWEVHQAIDSWRRGDDAARPIRRPPGKTETRYTLEVQHQPLGATARALAERLELVLRYPPELEAQLQQRVSFRVQEVTREQLLQALIEPAGLRFQVFDRTLEILPGEPD